MRPIWVLKFLGCDGCGVAVHAERFAKGMGEREGRQVRKVRKRGTFSVTQNVRTGKKRRGKETHL